VTTSRAVSNMSSSKTRIVLLGAGRVGAGIARDLASEFDVTVADASSHNLDRFRDETGLTLAQVDVSDEAELRRLVEPADLVIGAVPGPLGFAVLRCVLEARKHVVDISFFEEDAFVLDELAVANGCVAIVDCGVAPGCSNLLLGLHAAEMDEVHSFWCGVGGLPVVREWPFEYKAPFSPVDVIAEYTRPARFRRGGVDVTMPALSEIELLNLPGVGTLEAFNTDGLRTLLKTMPVADMVEKTMRYPGHAERMSALRATGFFSDEPIGVTAGVAVRPIDVTGRLLFDAWQFGEGEADLTVMRIVIDGLTGDSRIRHTYDLLDHYDATTGTPSMTRTTGYTCTAAVRLLAAELYTRPGITPPELLGGAPGCAAFMLAELARRGVVFRHTREILAD
jgi:lysine 6-dehydrogenase